MRNQSKFEQRSRWNKNAFALVAVSFAPEMYKGNARWQGHTEVRSKCDYFNFKLNIQAKHPTDENKVQQMKKKEI